MEFEAVGSQAMAAIWMMVIFGSVVPIAAAIIWTVKKKEKITSVLLGMAGFLAFAVCLEAIPLRFLFGNNASGQFFTSHRWAYILVGALMAGLFEETGRFFVFKVMLEKRKNKETAISYGIGHAGVEVFMILFVTGINNLLYAISINQGSYGALVEQARLMGDAQAEAMIDIARVLPTLSMMDVSMPIVERISASMFHIACSIIVFRAVREKGKIMLWPMAILLHTAFDCIAGLYQVGAIKNEYAIEAIIFVVAAAILAFAIMMYKKMPARYDADEDEAEAKALDDMTKMGL